MYIKRIDWCGVVVALFLALSVVAMSVLAFLPLTSQNVCFASSSDGIVENNLLLDNDFVIGSSSGQGWINGSSWWLGQSNSSGTFNNKTLSGSNTSGYVNIRQWLDGVRTDEDLTFRVQLASHTGNWLVQIWNYNDKNGTPSQGYTTGWQSSNYLSGTFQLSSQYNYFMFVIQCRDTITLDYAKLEYGTEFTGYVPRDYEHYGYNEGYDDGIQYMVDRQLLTNGVELLGSFPIVAMKYGTDGVWDSFYYNYGFSVSVRQGNPVFPPYDSFEYNGNTYCLSGPSPSGSLPPQYFSFLQYDSSNYTMSVSVPAWGNNYWSIFPIAYEVRYIGQSIYFTSDFVFGSPYRLIIRSTDGTNLVFVSDFTMSGNYNGVNFVDLTKYLVSGQSYNFYVTKTSANTALSFSTKNSYFTGISSLCIFTINDAYTVGVNNYDKGYDEGYELGYSRGFTEGDNAGYIRGVDESSDYGFYGMIGSAIDVPINAITGLLDFDLLGVNMKAFFLSIFSLAVLIVIVRLIVGGLS